jgi:hypothetical protein
MNGKPEPNQNFLVSTISAMLNGTLRPALYVMRSDLGIQHTALVPLIFSAVLYSAAFYAASIRSEADGKIGLLYGTLIVVGYLRNDFQARKRRRTRDWSVTTWSSGESLLVPVLRLICPRIRRQWGDIPAVEKWVRRVLHNDFVYYVAEPAVLLLAAVGIWSIGSDLYYYPVVLAITCIVVRNDAQLWLYLKAHEIPDGKTLERSINSEFEDPARRGVQTSVAGIPDRRFVPVATDSESVFGRLDQNLQFLLMKDSFLHSKPESESEQ